MMSIGVNLHNFGLSELTYNFSLEFYQIPSMFIIRREYKSKYINIDITNVVNSWIERDEENFGITLIGVNENGFALFSSARGEKLPYIKVIYKEKIEDENACGKESTDKISDIRSKAYGFFVNNSGNFVSEDRFNIVKWDKYNYLKNIEINKDGEEIIIRDKGIYMIDYSVNVRSNEFTCMSLIINDIELADSKIELGREEHISNGSILIGVSKENSHLRLGIRKTEMILSNVGAAASIRIMKV